MANHHETAHVLRRAYFLVVATGFATVAIWVLAGMTDEYVSAPEEYRRLTAQIELLDSIPYHSSVQIADDTLLAAIRTSTRYGARRDAWYNLQLPWRHQQLGDSSLEVVGPRILPFYADITYQRRLNHCVGWRDVRRHSYSDFPIDSFPQRMLCFWVGMDAILYWPVAAPPVTDVLVRNDDSIAPIDVLSRFDSVYFPSIVQTYTHNCTGYVPILYSPLSFDDKLRFYARPVGCHWLSQDTLLLTESDSIKVHNGQGVLRMASGMSIDAVYAFESNGDECPTSSEAQQWRQLGEVPWLGEIVQSLGDGRNACARITNGWVVSSGGLGNGVPRPLKALLDTIAGWTFEEAFPALHGVATQSAHGTAIDSVDLQKASEQVESRTIPSLLEDAEVYGIPVKPAILEVFLGPWVVVVHMFFLIHLSHTSQGELHGVAWIGAYPDRVSKWLFRFSLFVSPLAIVALALQGLLDAHGVVLWAIVALAVVQIMILCRYCGEVGPKGV